MFLWKFVADLREDFIIEITSQFIVKHWNHKSSIFNNLRTKVFSLQLKLILITLTRDCVLFQDALILNKSSVDRGTIYHPWNYECFSKPSWTNKDDSCNEDSNEVYVFFILFVFLFRVWPLFGLQEADLFVEKIRKSGVCLSSIHQWIFSNWVCLDFSSAKPLGVKKWRVYS